MENEHLPAMALWGTMIFWELFAGFEGLSRAVGQSGVAEVLPPLDYCWKTTSSAAHREIAPLRTFDGCTWHRHAAHFRAPDAQTNTAQSESCAPMIAPKATQMIKKQYAPTRWQTVARTWRPHSGNDEPTSP